MTATFDTDTSIFQVVQIPGVFIGCFEITEWFNKETSAKNRLVGDLTHIGDPLTFNSVDTLKAANPTRKYIGVVSNPWERAARIYDILKNASAAQKLDIPMYSSFNLTSFSNFINQISVLDKSAWPYWWWFDTNQRDWLNNVDYVVRSEHLAEDFAPIQAFFKSEEILRVDPDSSHMTYATRYNAATKDKVTAMFQTDIDTYGYTF
jgi:hypothetical protein